MFDSSCEASSPEKLGVGEVEKGTVSLNFETGERSTSMLSLFETTSELILSEGF